MTPLTAIYWVIDHTAMETNTATQILDVAQVFVRNRGYSAFSYADIAEQVGIRKASIHYHFPTKDQLVKELVQRYRESFLRLCQRITGSGQRPQEQLLAFAGLYRDGLAEDQICLCGMLSADFAVLPWEIQEEIRLFFQQVEQWLTHVLQAANGSLQENNSPSAARELIALLSGAQLLSRTAADPEATFDAIVQSALKKRWP